MMSLPPLPLLCALEGMAASSIPSWASHDIIHYISCWHCAREADWSCSEPGSVLFSEHKAGDKKQF